jgi:hypothetical protein
MTQIFGFCKSHKAAPPEGGEGVTFIQRLKPMAFPSLLVIPQKISTPGHSSVLAPGNYGGQFNLDGLIFLPVTEYLYFALSLVKPFGIKNPGADAGGSDPLTKNSFMV